MSEKFSLKDHLFNEKSVARFCELFYKNDKEFPKKFFMDSCFQYFPNLELKERSNYMAKLLLEILPKDFQKSSKIILKALPEKLDPKKNDDDFGDFVLAPLSDYVSFFADQKKNLKTALSLLQEITMRFSAEFAIRDFINNFPEETFIFLEGCAKDKNYHVRRLASEGLRPKLPWAKKIILDYKKPENILRELFFDKADYVRRSVANHLNDISKIDSGYLLGFLKTIHISDKRDEKYLKHALRGLLKKSNPQALDLLGYKGNSIMIKNFSLDTITLSPQKEFSCSFDFYSLKDSKVQILALLNFPRKNGTRGEKVYKVFDSEIPASFSKRVVKRISLVDCSTRTWHGGEYSFSIVSNGVVLSEKNKFNFTKK